MAAPPAGDTAGAVDTGAGGCSLAFCSCLIFHTFFTAPPVRAPESMGEGLAGEVDTVTAAAAPTAGDGADTAAIGTAVGAVAAPALAVAPVIAVPVPVGAMAGETPFPVGGRLVVRETFAGDGTATVATAFEEEPPMTGTGEAVDPL